jgi:hypothetical protein
MTSPDGILWSSKTSATDNNWSSICWSPELGVFCAVSQTGSGDRVMTSSLRGRPPTSYNTFNSPFNRIDTSGNWSFKAKQVKTTDSSLFVETTFSDLELKCNSTGSGGTIQLSGGTGLVETIAGSDSGKYLCLTINGTPYKIPLLNV